MLWLGLEPGKNRASTSTRVGPQLGLGLELGQGKDRAIAGNRARAQELTLN